MEKQAAGESTVSNMTTSSRPDHVPLIQDNSTASACFLPNSSFSSLSRVDDYSMSPGMSFISRPDFVDSNVTRGVNVPPQLPMDCRSHTESASNNVSSAFSPSDPLSQDIFTPSTSLMSTFSSFASLPRVVDCSQSPNMDVFIRDDFRGTHGTPNVNTTPQLSLDSTGKSQIMGESTVNSITTVFSPYGRFSQDFFNLPTCLVSSGSPASFSKNVSYLQSPARNVPTRPYFRGNPLTPGVNLPPQLMRDNTRENQTQGESAVNTSTTLVRPLNFPAVPALPLSKAAGSVTQSTHLTSLGSSAKRSVNEACYSNIPLPKHLQSSTVKTKSHSVSVQGIKQGTPTDDELEELGNEIAEKWMKLGRRLGFNEPKLQDIEQNHRQLCEKGYHMLMDWKQENGSAATYQNLNVALQHKLVQRKDLAEQICYRHDLLPGDTFDVKICRQKLAEHYIRTAKVPTSVWSKTSAVNIDQIYTRLSWVKEEQTPAGSSRAELNHYTDVLAENKNGLPSNRILVQGQTGIGKSTFVKKLAKDWAKLDENTKENMNNVYCTESPLQDFQEASSEYTAGEESEVSWSGEGDYTSSTDSGDTSSDESDATLPVDYEVKIRNRLNVLKKFEIVLVIDLKQVSKCSSLRDVIDGSHIFADEDATLTEGLLSYITKNQDKVLLVFDGYDEYHCASNSEIFEIFRGNKLRNCCVLMTTRISKADELKKFKDVHAEITGLSEVDRKAFMIRILGDKTQAKKLRKHLNKRDLKDLARVPQLLLFFCTLWKKGKLQSFPDSKTKLYVAIIQYVLDHNEGKCSSSNFRKLEDFTEILAEIGKVALECLLNDDHVFEYDQLSAAILSEESRIMGLLQVSEYAENIRPAGMVSFFHKSIQEFLAAWYITYRCVLKGNLGEINDRARTLDKCTSLENVFKFICGLSDGGSVKVFEHLTSVRVSDSELDLSKTIPDEQRETDVTLSGVTNKQIRFINLVYDSFDEVESKTELLRHCLNCTEGIIFLSPYGRSISDLVPERKILNEVSIRGVVFCGRWNCDKMTVLCESLEFLNCLHIPPKATENLAAVSAEEILKKFESVKCKRFCGLGCILHFHSGQTLFYFTELKLRCDDHAKLFTENFAPSHSASLCPKSSSLKFLRFLHFASDIKEPTMRSFSTIIRDCKGFESFQIHPLNESALECLEQIPNPLTCRLVLRRYGEWLTSSKGLKLASLLPRFNNLIEFGLDLQNCCAEAENKLVCSITHKTLQELTLSNLRMTPAIAAALGRSLPEMSSLKILWLIGRKGSTVQVEDMEALFGGFNKTFPALKDFRFSCFSFRGGFAELTERFHFFPSLWRVYLSCSNLHERDLRGLVCSLKSIPNLRSLWLEGNPLSDNNRVKSIVKQALTQAELKETEVRFRDESDGDNDDDDDESTLGKKEEELLGAKEKTMEEVSEEKESLETKGSITEVKIRQDAETSSTMEIPQAESSTRMKSLLYAESEECNVDHQGTIWNLTEIQAGGCITFTQDAVSMPLLFGCKLLEPTVEFPPLNKDERLVSSVIELTCDEQSDIHFTGQSKGEVVVALSHSAPKLEGYEVLIGELVSSDSSYEWKDLETTNIWQIPDIKDDFAKLRVPYSEAKVTTCGVFAVIYRLKSYIYSTRVSGNEEITHKIPEYPEVSVTIPAENVRDRSNLELILKVQEIPQQWFDCGEEFAGPVLHIKCPQITDLVEPATITLPLLLQGDKDELSKFSATDLRVFKCRSGDERADWDEITMQLPNAVELMNGVVIFQVKHFCRFTVWPSKKRRLRDRRLAHRINRFTRPFPLEAGFFACLCNTVDMSPGHAQLRVYCYPARLEPKVIENACSAHDIDRYGNGDSLLTLFHGDELRAKLWRGSEVKKTLKLRFRYDGKFEVDAIVRVPKEDTPHVRFLQHLREQSPRELCKLTIATQCQRKARDPHHVKQEVPSSEELERLSQQVPSDEELEWLSHKLTRWKTVGRCLGIKEATLTAISKENEEYFEKIYQMLLNWKKRESSAATYQVIHEALCHELVERADLAEELYSRKLR